MCVFVRGNGRETAVYLNFFEMVLKDISVVTMELSWNPLTATGLHVLHLRRELLLRSFTFSDSVRTFAMHSGGRRIQRRYFSKSITG